MNFSEMKVRGVFSFTTYNGAILGAQHSKMLLVSSADYTEVAEKEMGLAERHIAMYSSLPAGTTKDATKLTWLVFRDANGKRHVMAYEWLVASSIQMNQYSRLEVKVRIESTGQQAEILAYLAKGGYTVLESNLA